MRDGLDKFNHLDLFILDGIIVHGNNADTKEIGQHLAHCLKTFGSKQKIYRDNLYKRLQWLVARGIVIKVRSNYNTFKVREEFAYPVTLMCNGYKALLEAGEKVKKE